MNALTALSASGQDMLSLIAALLIMLALFAMFFGPLTWAFIKRLPRRLQFSLVVTCMSIGATTVLFTVLIHPLTVYLDFIAPQFQHAGLPYGRWIRAPLKAVTAWAILWVPFIDVTLTLAITLSLAKRWPAIVGRLRLLSEAAKHEPISSANPTTSRRASEG